MKNFICVFLVTALLIDHSLVVAETLRKEAGYTYIATFNIYILGAVESKYKNLDEWESPSVSTIPKRIKNIASVIAVGGFDLIAIQEVASKAKGYFAIKDLQKALSDYHGLKYRFIISDEIGKGFRIDETIAFLYKPDKVRHAKIGNKRSKNISIPGRDLVKTQWVIGNFDFTLISAHLEWANEDARDKGYKKIKEIYDSPLSFSSDPDVVIVGDFNRFGENYDSVTELTYDPTKFLAPNVTFFDPEFSVIKQIKKKHIKNKGIPGDNPQLLSTTVAKNTSVYDLIMFSIDSAEEFPQGTNEAIYGKDFGIIHFDEEDGFGYQPNTSGLGHNDLKKAYSDHRPLWIRFKTNTANSDRTW